MALIGVGEMHKPPERLRHVFEHYGVESRDTPEREILLGEVMEKDALIEKMVECGKVLDKQRVPRHGRQFWMSVGMATKGFGPSPSVKISPIPISGTPF